MLRLYEWCQSLASVRERLEELTGQHDEDADKRSTSRLGLVMFDAAVLHLTGYLFWHVKSKTLPNDALYVAKIHIP